MGSGSKTTFLKALGTIGAILLATYTVVAGAVGGALVPEIRQMLGLDHAEEAVDEDQKAGVTSGDTETGDGQPEEQQPASPQEPTEATPVGPESQQIRQSVPEQRSPIRVTSHTLGAGSPLFLQDLGTTVSVEFFDELGGYATLRIHPEGGESIVESVLGPGGDIRFQTSSGPRRLSVTSWDKEARTLDIMIHPGG